MNLRALIVLLVVLNLGVAAWWLFRPDTAPETLEDTPSGVATLELVGERNTLHQQPASSPAQPTPLETTPADAMPPAVMLPPKPAPTAASNVITPVAPAEAPAAQPTVAERCYTLGPFTDADALSSARTHLRASTLRLNTREIREGGSRGWRVSLPAAADRQTADAMAAKIMAAGFTDLLVIANGPEANSIALGRFSTEARAQQHARTVRAAGFAAKAEALDDIRVSSWIDLAAAAGFDIAAARRATGAAQLRNLDCGTVR